MRISSKKCLEPPPLTPESTACRPSRGGVFLFLFDWQFQLLRESPHAQPMVFSSLLRAGSSQCFLDTASRPPQVLLLQTKESHFSVLNSQDFNMSFEIISTGGSAVRRHPAQPRCSFFLGSRTTHRPNLFKCFHATVGIAIPMHNSFTANCMSGRSWRHAVCTCCKLLVLQ